MILFQVLGPAHDRSGFRCGVASLDRYLRETANQVNRKRLGVVVVAVEPERPSEILGYYAVAFVEVEGATLPDILRKPDRLPSHGFGTVIIGRLAVDERARGRGIGRMLLHDAFWRAFRAAEEVGSPLVVVDAIDEAAARFYEKFGFRRVGMSRLIISMGTVEKMIVRTE